MINLKLDLQKGNKPTYALNCFIKGLSMLKQPGIRQYLFIPILINLFLYTITLVLGYYYITDLINQFIPSWLEWLNWLIWPMFFLSFFAISFFTFTLLANLIAAPFYSKLAAKTLQILIGQQTMEINEQPVIKSLLSELKRILYLLLRALPLLVLFVIPVINIIAPVLWLLFAAWSMALEYMAYPLENRGLLFPEQRKIAKPVRLGTLCLGGLVVFGLTIPFLNILIPPAAVIATTIYFHGLQDQA